MNPSLATLVYACGIAGLFYLDRESSVRTSKALWLPVAYLWILGSRPVSYWLGMSPPQGANIQLDGSPVDAAFFQLLLFVALGVLIDRGRRTLTFLNANFPILAYFLFCLLSVIWSDFPAVAFKRWIKAIGDVVMVLIILTDAQPAAALRRVFSRVGFILIPVSLLYIKYYPGVGRTYDQWTGGQMNVGLTTDKNMLGVITFVLLMGTEWQVLTLLRSHSKTPHQTRHIVAQGALVALGISLLITSNSVTSLLCFVMGSGLMLATNLRFVRRHPAAIHVLLLLLAATVGSAMLFGKNDVVQALGRKPTLSGRTEIWETVIPMVPNALVGAGFESFWLSPRVAGLKGQLMFFQLNEAHDGYIEVYLELGWIGVCLMGIILIDGYRRSVKAFRYDPALGSLILAYVLTTMVYSVTEAGFRMLDPIWIFFLLAVIQASSVAAPPDVRAPHRAQVDPISPLTAKNAFSKAT
jgi:O-antigen ligase